MVRLDREQWPLTVTDTCLCPALDIMHRLGYVHRDVNYSNVFLVTRESSEPVGMLVDLDSSRKIREPGRYGARTGSPYFMAIEVADQFYAFVSGKVTPPTSFLYNPLHGVSLALISEFCP